MYFHILKSDLIIINNATKELKLKQAFWVADFKLDTDIGQYKVL
jgi:hypothetical protein